MGAASRVKKILACLGAVAGTRPPISTGSTELGLRCPGGAPQEHGDGSAPDAA